MNDDLSKHVTMFLRSEKDPITGERSNMTKFVPCNEVKYTKPEQRRLGGVERLGKKFFCPENLDSISFNRAAQSYEDVRDGPEIVIFDACDTNK